MSVIAEIRSDEDLEPYVRIIKESFLTVAAELGLTEENNPTNPAFMTLEKLKRSKNERVRYYTLIKREKPVGFMAIEQSQEDITTYYIERLAVLPEYRHKGLGKELMAYAESMIYKHGGRKLSVALIDQNRKLKDWYKNQGFEESGFKEFTHLPFRVCFMAKELI